MKLKIVVLAVNLLRRVICYLEELHAILISTPKTRLASIDAAVCNTLSTSVVFAGAVIDNEDDFDETLDGATA